MKANWSRTYQPSLAAIRNVYLNPCSVILSATDTGTRKGMRVALGYADTG